MNRRSFFRALLGAPLAVPAIALAASKPAYASGGMVGPYRFRDYREVCTTGESGSEAVMHITRGERINVTVNSDDAASFIRNAKRIRDHVRRSIDTAARSR